MSKRALGKAIGKPSKRKVVVAELSVPDLDTAAVGSSTVHEHATNPSWVDLMYEEKKYDEELRKWLNRYMDLILPCTYIKDEIIEEKFRTAYGNGTMEKFLKILENAYGNKEIIKNTML